MGTNSFDSINDGLSSDAARTDHPRENRRQLLELQLIQVRKEADAARLEARAAELELLIRQLCGEPTGPPPSPLPVDATSVTVSEHPAKPVRRFDSWSDVEARLAPEPRTDHPGVSGQPTAAAEDSAPATAHTPESPAHARAASITAGGLRQRKQADTESETAGAFDAPLELLSEDSKTESVNAEDVSIENDSLRSESQAEVSGRRRKPAAWLVSALFHVAILVVLAFIGLQTQRPKDQIALSASASQSNEVSIETFTIEATEPTPETTEPTPSDVEVELSPVGELAASKLAPESPLSPPLPNAASMSSSAVASAAMSLKSDSEAKIQFCGVEGGGNHFVYLVDSSNSMGKAFESARRELLASIDALKPTQRFYVIFFDAESDYMRLASATEDEPHSVEATDENKAALRRWATRIGMDKGLAPYDALRFALELKPDVIFLLSDGEFPQGIEDLLRDENKTENLFGDRNLISIVHTIGYHSREGENRMRRIAEQNRGQYRHIPKR